MRPPGGSERSSPSAAFASTRCCPALSAATTLPAADALGPGSDPHAGEPGLALGGQPEGVQRAQRHLFERAHVPVHVLARPIPPRRVT